MIFGAHIIIYSKNAEADRAFLQDVMGFPSVDAGGGWLILGMPPSEVAVHPAEANDRHELFLMCEDLKQEMANLEARGVRCSSVQEARWGSICNIFPSRRWEDWSISTKTRDGDPKTVRLDP